MNMALFWRCVVGCIPVSWWYGQPEDCRRARFWAYSNSRWWYWAEKAVRNAKTTKIILARCDFCERTTLDLEDGETMIASPGASSLALARAHICSECVRVAMELLKARQPDAAQ